MTDTATFIIAVLALVLAGLSNVLHLIAPRTKTTVDDRLVLKLDELKEFLAKLVRPAAMVLLVMLGIGASTAACSWLKSQGDIAKAAVVDCTTSTAHDAISQFGPALDAQLVQATDPNGKVNWQRMKDLSKGLRAELGGCVLATVVAHELAPDKPDPNAPKSSPLELDATSLRQGFDDIRRAQFHGATFKTDSGLL
jgi:hypothetical protein